MNFHYTIVIIITFMGATHLPHGYSCSCFPFSLLVCVVACIPFLCTALQSLPMYQRGTVYYPFQMLWLLGCGAFKLFDLMMWWFFDFSNPMCKMPYLLDFFAVVNGQIKRTQDEDIHSNVLEIVGSNVQSTYITCPADPAATLGIKLPFLVMIVKNLKKYFTFEIQVLDDKNVRRRFRASNFQVCKSVQLF